MKKGQIKVDKDRVARALFERGLTPVEPTEWSFSDTNLPRGRSQTAIHIDERR